MKKNAGLIILLLVSAQLLAGPADTTQLKAKPVFGKEAKIISYLLDNNHYRKIRFGDSLSSVVLDSYFSELDNNKIYFLASDVQQFEKYRTKLDELTRSEDVKPAFEIYKVFQTRY